MPELRDLYDINSNKTDKTYYKGNKIPEGYYPMVVMIVIRNSKGEFLMQKRVESKGGDWGVTGGHPKHGESPRQGIITEVKEELGVDISVEKFICTTNYNYPSFCLTMHCYLCCITNGEIELREHKSARWLSSKHFSSIDWLPADKVVIDKITLDLISRL